MGRKPFWFHTLGRDRLAQTRAAEALRLLANDYREVRDYPEYSRYTLASLLGLHFDRPEHIDGLVALRTENNQPIDTWLWVQSLRAEADLIGDSEVLRIANTSKSVHHRAAAIAALGQSQRGDLKSAIVANCLEFPRKPKDRMLLLGAMTGALHEQRGRVNDSEYREALKAYISLLADSVKLPHLAKVQMSRHLQWILNAPAMFVNPEAWLELMDRGDVKLIADNRTRSQPRFFGIETEGERFVYVVDMSDSMCKPIAPSARPRNPTTGPRKKKKKGSMVLDESDLPWHAIETRWDLAREQLRISLSRLSSDKHFAIVWFGTEAGTLKTTKGMVRASKKNIKKALAELDSIRAGEPVPRIAPDGKLRGNTNMHGGLRLAFGLGKRGFVDELAYVDGAPLTEGCDTMFLLSDGAPSWDDFPMVDKDYGEGVQVLDQEYGEQVQRTPQTQYHGPYVDDRWLIEDLKRMNAFRRIRVHCVGLGEARISLLEKLADIGNGEVFIVGNKK